ncbi:hypothetical protein Tco_0663558 [Tanacetum coccineum]
MESNRYSNDTYAEHSIYHLLRFTRNYMAHALSLAKTEEEEIVLLYLGVVDDVLEPNLRAIFPTLLIKRVELVRFGVRLKGKGVRWVRGLARKGLSLRFMVLEVELDCGVGRFDGVVKVREKVRKVWFGCSGLSLGCERGFEGYRGGWVLRSGRFELVGNVSMVMVGGLRSSGCREVWLVAGIIVGFQGEVGWYGLGKGSRRSLCLLATAGSVRGEVMRGVRVEGLLGLVECAGEEVGLDEVGGGLCLERVGGGLLSVGGVGIGVGEWEGEADGWCVESQLIGRLGWVEGMEGLGGSVRGRGRR